MVATVAPPCGSEWSSTKRVAMPFPIAACSHSVRHRAAMDPSQFDDMDAAARMARALALDGIIYFVGGQQVDDMYGGSDVMHAAAARGGACVLRARRPESAVKASVDLLQVRLAAGVKMCQTDLERSWFDEALASLAVVQIPPDAKAVR